jgi:hypothetical protein
MKTLIVLAIAATLVTAAHAGRPCGESPQRVVDV